MLAKAEVMDSLQRVVLDMDSTEIPVYGEQEQSATTGTLINLHPNEIRAVQDEQVRQ